MITPEMDAGDYVAQVRIQNHEGQSISDIMLHVEEKILLELLNSWEALKTGKATLHQQNKLEVTYAKKRREADGEINWNKPAREVHNFVRAQSKPYPGAYFKFQEKVFRVYSSNISDKSHDIEVGYIIGSRKDIIEISCGNGTVINLPLSSIESEDKSNLSELKVGLNLNSAKDRDD
jgi:methionyl-tRNA formyltransferase